MTLIALLIGLIIERLATQLFHWRRMRWLDRIIDRGFALSEQFANWPALIRVPLGWAGQSNLAKVVNPRETAPFVDQRGRRVALQE